MLAPWPERQRQGLTRTTTAALEPRPAFGWTGLSAARYWAGTVPHIKDLTRGWHARECTTHCGPSSAIPGPTKASRLAEDDLVAFPVQAVQAPSAARAVTMEMQSLHDALLLGFHALIF